MRSIQLGLSFYAALVCSAVGHAQLAQDPAPLPAPKASAPASFAFAASPLQNPASLLSGGKAVLAALRKGGYLIYFRHGKTRYDQIGLERENLANGRWVASQCDTQRNLSDDGRAELHAAGEQFRKAQIPVDRAYSSHFCRTRQTAAYFADNAQVFPWLAGFEGGTAANGTAGSRQMQLEALFRKRPAAGKNTLIAAHGMTLRSVTGFAIEEGHAVVLDPGNLKVVVARIAPGEWAAVALGQ